MREAGERKLSSALYGAERGGSLGGDLGKRLAMEIGEPDNRTLLRGQLAHCAADGARRHPRRCHLEWVIPRRGNAAMRHHRFSALSTSTAARHVERCVSGCDRQPWTDAGRSHDETGSMAPEREKRFLDGVLRTGLVAQHAVCHGAAAAGVQTIRFCERVGVIVRQPRNEVDLGRCIRRLPFLSVRERLVRDGDRL